MANKSWLEQIYYFAEYYYYEPQQIFKIAKDGCTGSTFIDKARDKVRRNEVPLNICFNVLLRLLPQKTVASIIESATSTKPIFFNNSCKFVSFYDEIGNVDNFIQPDAVLDSLNTRVYIELKIDAEIQIAQIIKYMYFHAEWNHRLNEHKQMALLLISPKSMKATFKAATRGEIFSDIGSELEELQNYLVGFDTTKFGNGNGVDLTYLDSEVKELSSAMIISHMTWHEVADHLESKIDDSNTNLINDFVEDIRRREF